MLNALLENIDLSILQDLRQRLHQYPDLSGQESATAQIIETFLQQTRPSEIFRQLGGHGIAVIYDSGEPGPYIGFRCELDALPIQEIQPWDHRSCYDGASHKCGHDGHMSIMAGIGLWIKQNPLSKGKIMLLFQPAEETGQGAPAILEDSRWKEIKPEWLFGLHNIPGFPEGSVLCKDGPFCAASKGMMVTLNGITSHAGEPEKGNNPNLALARIMLDLQALPFSGTKWQNEVLLTPVFAHLGEKAFGTSPGAAEFGATLRSFEEADMELLTAKAEKIIEEHALAQELGFEINYQEVFPATVNLPAATAYVRESAKEAGLIVLEMAKAFRWSEDFGWYARDSKTSFFGLGAGENQPSLHHPDYDFPDQIIAPGMALFIGIAKAFLYDGMEAETKKEPLF